MSADVVLAERRGSVLLLTLNRPERLNAWNDELEERYFALLDEAEADPEVRAVVVTGAGRGFCAGADMDVLVSIGAREVVELPEHPRPRHRPLMFCKPLIAAINGAAAGLGLVEALYCDQRFATPEAKLTTSFARRGLIAEYGVAWLLPRLVGQSRALDLLMSARVVRGDEALRMGLVDRVVDADDLVDAAVAYAQDLATHCSPTSMSVIKRQVLQALDTDIRSALADAESEMVQSFHRADVAEGVASYLEGRAPAFPGVSVP
ncbi:enoyl-CoA hydratase [Mumia zhuanghuii]|uniref:Enoyl-CoA hydratase-related protein n=2 Tax=Mumia TaxID=1546255 RepID=A0ABW1QQP4_9ACTN|nr:MULTISPECIES: enoyl-CoA hydratase-related protein [Mumia]KAA1422298.1 enoyl-CoA hydratase [Mumia zhuanghuii]